MNTDPLKERWERDYDAMASLLMPWRVVIDDREYFDTAAAPAGRVELFRGLTSVGYAKGWL